jgi:serine-type D-Ala-D-Ala carboxypeptidase (penicillin-binding protein 5/6)
MNQILNRIRKGIGSHKRAVIAGTALTVASVVVVSLALRPIADAAPRTTLASAGVREELVKPQMLWSPYGQQALAIVRSPTLAINSGKNDVFPMASIAKVMTALVLLQEKPLALGEPGPSMTITAGDVAVYERELAQNQSVVAVEAGERLTEYQIIEAMLVPSATNVADSAAVWAFGSMDAYLAKANAYAASLGMNESHFGGDASGFSPKSYSTPQDLIKLGTAAMAHPVIAEIVGKTSVDLPVAGTMRNFNISLGTEGINGIKTGNTDEAGGAFLFSAPFHGRLIVGAIMGAPDLGTALHDSVEILRGFKSTLQVHTLVGKGQKVGEYILPWGEKINAVIDSSISVLEWKGGQPPVSVSLSPIPADAKKGQKVGTVSVEHDGQTLRVDILLEKTPSKPSIWWRIFHR